MYHDFLICSSTAGYLDSFHVLAAVTDAVVNVGVQVSSWVSAFVSCERVSRSGIAGSFYT